MPWRKLAKNTSNKTHEMFFQKNRQYLLRSPTNVNVNHSLNSEHVLTDIDILEIEF